MMNMKCHNENFDDKIKFNSAIRRVNNLIVVLFMGL